MITEKDLQEAIIECHAVRNPNANTCLKLASFYTILDHLSDKEVKGLPDLGYSFLSPPDEPDITIDIDSGTEFAEAIKGKDPSKVWPIIDEAMGAIMVLQPRLYAAILRKLNDL